MTRPLVVILAGGEGRRIGGDKPLRLLGGRTLLVRAVAIAADWSDDVRLSLKEPGQVPPAGLQPVFDVPGIAGPLSGLAAGLAAATEAGRDAVLLLPCDMPFVPHDLLARLEAEIGNAHAALASSGGELHPVCGLWRTDALQQLPHYLESGQRSVKGFAATVGFRTVVWEGAEDPFFNINDLDGLRGAEARLQKSRTSTISPAR